MIKILKPCPSCGNRRFEISDGNATCTGSQVPGFGWDVCGKTWELSDELKEKFEMEE